MSSYALKEEKKILLSFPLSFFSFPNSFLFHLYFISLVLMERDGLAWLAASLDLHIKHIEEMKRPMIRTLMFLCWIDSSGVVPLVKVRWTRGFSRMMFLTIMTIMGDKGESNKTFKENLNWSWSICFFCPFPFPSNFSWISQLFCYVSIPRVMEIAYMVPR